MLTFYFKDKNEFDLKLKNGFIKKEIYNYFKDDKVEAIWIRN